MRVSAISYLEASQKTAVFGYHQSAVALFKNELVRTGNYAHHMEVHSATALVGCAVLVAEGRKKMIIAPR
jgi:hypothetical protein